MDSNPHSVPTFEKSIEVSKVQQSNFRAQENDGRWLVGKRSELNFFAYKAQTVEVNLSLYVPYNGQSVVVKHNGSKLFETSRLPTFSGIFDSSFLIQMEKGPNNFVFSTDKSNRDGSNRPFSIHDASDISIFINKLTFKRPIVDGKRLFGAQPGNNLTGVYISSGPDGLKLLFGQNGALEVEFCLLRRFKKQAFSFYLDGLIIKEIKKSQPGRTIYGNFSISPSATFKRDYHTIELRSDPTANLTAISPTAATDSRSVQFYVQKLEVSQLKPRFSRNLENFQLTALCLLLILAAAGILFRK